LLTAMYSWQCVLKHIYILAERERERNIEMDTYCERVRERASGRGRKKDSGRVGNNMCSV